MNQAQINFLKQIAVGDISGVVIKKYGLCFNLGSFDAKDFISENCQDWEHFSGNTTYPVGGMKAYLDSDNLYEGEQLELRSSLAKHLLSKLGENV